MSVNEFEEEFFDVCDEAGLPTGETVGRKRAHSEGICHRTAHVWIARFHEGRYQILLQKRSSEKESFPGKLDTSSAGHIPAGSEPVESALRELEEELGIRAVPGDLEFCGQFRIQYEKVFHGKPFRDNEVANVYLCRKKVDIADMTIQKEELDGVYWFDLEETLAALERHDDANCIPRGGLELLRKKLLQTG